MRPVGGVERAASTNTVAVLDFAVAGEPAPPEDWAYGLADLFAIELQRRGIALYERRDVRFILREKALGAVPVGGPGSTFGRDLPGIRFLAGGTLRQTAPGRFHLLVSLAEARSGIESASVDGAGAFPRDIPSVLADAADRIVARLPIDDRARPPTLAPGFSRTPEVSWLLYRGIEHCLADQPDRGAVFFIEAQRADRQFVAAKVWKLRAFEMLGFTEFTRLAREELAATPDGTEALARMDRGDWRSPKRLVLALIAQLRLPEPGAALLARLRRTLEESGGLAVFDPDRIEGLAAEMDLEFTARFGARTELTRIPWTAVHGVVGFEWLSASTSRPARIRLSYRPALAARPTLVEEIPSERDALEALGRRLVRQIRERTAPASAEPTVTTTARADVGPEFREPARGWLDPPMRDDLAAIFRHLRDHPGDREAWRILSGLRDWIDDRYQAAIQDHLIAGVDPAEPHADLLLSEFLWTRRWAGTRSPPSKVTSVPLETEFAPLLDRFPDSLAGDYVRVVIALHALQRHEFAVAAAKFIELEQALRRKDTPPVISAEYWACYHCYTAAALRGCGRDNEARTYFARADALFREHPDLRPYERVDGFWGREERGKMRLSWANPFPATHELFGSATTLQEAVARALRASTTGLGNLIADPSEFGNFEALERLFQEADQVTGRAAAPLHRQRVVALIRHKERHPQLYVTEGGSSDSSKAERVVDYGRRRMKVHSDYTLSEKLVLEASGSLNCLMGATLVAEDLRELQSLGRQLAQGLPGALASHCLESVGLYADARQLLEQRHRQIQSVLTASAPGTSEAYRGRHEVEFERYQLVLEIAHLWERSGKPTTAAEFLQAQLSRLRPAHKLTAARRAAEAWIEAGRPDTACELFRDLAGQPWPSDSYQNLQATVRFHWAEFEMERGSLFEATELLRTLAKESDGKSWSVDDSGRTLLLKDNVLNRLALARILAGVRIQSRDWEPRPRARSPYAPVPPLPDGATSPADLELQDILLDHAFAAEYTAPNRATDDFVQRHGRAGLAAVLRALELDDYAAPRLLEKLAQPADAAAVLESFKRHPELARLAFKLDPAAATRVLRERLGVLAQGHVLSYELWRVVERHRLHDQYPVLLANLAGEDWNAHGDVVLMDRILSQDPDPELEAQFREILAHRLELHLATGRDYLLDYIARVAVKRGVRQGIDALRRAPEQNRPDVVAFLRDYLDLPADTAAAWQVLEAGRGQWDWNERERRYHRAEP